MRSSLTQFIAIIVCAHAGWAWGGIINGGFEASVSSWPGWSEIFGGYSGNGWVSIATDGAPEGSNYLHLDSYAYADQFTAYGSGWSAVAQQFDAEEGQILSLVVRNNTTTIGNGFTDSNIHLFQIDGDFNQWFSGPWFDWTPIIFSPLPSSGVYLIEIRVNAMALNDEFQEGIHFQGIEMFVDEVQLSPVPEPAGIILIATCGIAVGRLWSRRHGAKRSR